MGQPAWGLYKDEDLVATIRAKRVGEAVGIFKAHGFKGDYVRKLKK